MATIGDPNAEEGGLKTRVKSCSTFLLKNCFDSFYEGTMFTLGIDLGTRGNGDKGVRHGLESSR